ncbi:hypothetical protein BGW80DRAFT_1290971 [Lactifluus volemus]|nr:hypothetical protein BGW80DRAFT_1290971 [Lactifluus volemus]
MTVGKDISCLFPDVLKDVQTEDIEQKKLVYLYPESTHTRAGYSHHGLCPRGEDHRLLRGPSAKVLT